MTQSFAAIVVTVAIGIGWLGCSGSGGGGRSDESESTTPCAITTVVVRTTGPADAGACPVDGGADCSDCTLTDRVGSEQEVPPTCTCNASRTKIDCTFSVITNDCEH
jgi:hypothetical protein